MRKQVTEESFRIWISAKDTYNWTNRPNNRWPCSTLENKRFFAEVNQGDLVDLTINGRYLTEKSYWIDSIELTAMISDYIRPYLPKEHPCKVFLT